MREPRLDPAGVVESLELIWRELEIERREVVDQLRAGAYAEDRDDRRVVALSQEPGDRHLAGGRAALPRDRVGGVSDLEVSLAGGALFAASRTLQVTLR